MPSESAPVHRDLILKVATRHKMPAVWFERNFVTAGGLLSYGPGFNLSIPPRSGYVDRILKGEKPADLPVQAPTKFELVVNLMAAKGAGLIVAKSVPAPIKALV